LARGDPRGSNELGHMVTIRLTRRGAKNSPFYHVVVTDSRKRQGGLSLELVGFFNPVARKNDVKLKLDLARIDYWVSKGAQLSLRVRDLTAEYRKAQPVAAAA
jgi:small subunit ribosomal protein S16